MFVEFEHCWTHVNHSGSWLSSKVQLVNTLNTDRAPYNKPKAQPAGLTLALALSYGSLSNYLI
ncbi:hypothetical protein [Lactobacillus crispatus]|uniref:Uncharacterized protein n=1 Tax=Lactobacillus crispatus TaxID=47770 RepID=A0ABV2B566_9LACO